MIKLKYGLLVMCSLLAAGCSVVAQSEIKKIEDVETDELVQLSNTYAGDNSKVMDIVQTLPGAETMKELDLRENQIKVSYGAKKGSLPQEEIFAFWFDDHDAMEKNFFFNAVYLTLLIPNSDQYVFAIEDFSFSVNREAMLAALTERFPSFPVGQDAEEEQAIAEFINSHALEIEEWTSADISRKAFFYAHPIAYTSR